MGVSGEPETGEKQISQAHQFSHHRRGQTDSGGAVAHLLYLLNISFLPVVAFLILLILNAKKNNSNAMLARIHFRQAIVASVISGVLLLAVTGCFFLFGSWDSPYLWMSVLIYFTCIHSALLLFGVFAWVKASNGQAYIYPLWGKYFVKDISFEK